MSPGVQAKYGNRGETGMLHRFSHAFLFHSNWHVKGGVSGWDSPLVRLFLVNA